LPKFIFFRKFLLNVAYAVVFSYPIVLLSLLIIPLRSPISNFLFTTFIMFAILVFRFWREGYDAAAKERVRISQFISAAIPVWAILAIVQTVIIFFFNTQVSGNGIFSLSLILSGNLNANALRIGKMPENIMPAFPISILLNSILYTAFAYIGYRLGILQRETERKNTLSGNDAEFRFYKKMPFFICFIPLCNIVSLFPWLISYLVMPERKLSRLFKIAAIMLALLLLMRGLHIAFYTICQVEWVYRIFYILTVYALCVAYALIAYYDEQKHTRGS